MFVCVIHRQLTSFKGEAKALKLFAKHIKVVEMTVNHRRRVQIVNRE